jgi:hypothetical protein
MIVGMKIGTPPSLYRFESIQSPPPPQAQPGPTADDWRNLVDFIYCELPWPDITSTGECILSADHAAAIRALGWEARAGSGWRCPLIPAEHLLPGLWSLADDFDPSMQLVPWRFPRAQFRRPSPADPLSCHEHQLLDLLRSAINGRLTRRQLLQKVSHQFSARYLDHMLARLLAQNFITVRDDWISLM